MARFSKQTQNFLKSVGADPYMSVQMVPKSDSCAYPGDVLFFRYKLGEGGNYTPASLETLYKNKELPEDNYRTYIMSHIFGPLRRIRKS